MEWWPTAQPIAWEWRWQPYPGPWLLAGLLAFGYLAALQRIGPRWTPPGDRPASRGQITMFLAGCAVLLVVADWPVGLLGAGYLLSVHAAQHLVIAMAVAPLLLLGTPWWLGGLPLRRRSLAAMVRVLTFPPVAILLFTGTFFVTHTPGVVSVLHPSQLGSAAVILAWLATSLLLWWPLIAPAPSVRRLGLFTGTPYLIAQFILPKVPGGIFVFSEQPYFPLYESAPRVVDSLDPALDQQLTGALIWVLGGVLVIGAIGVMLRRWQREESRRGVVRDLGLPASSRALAALFAVPGAWDALERLTTIVRQTVEEQAIGAELGFTFLDPPAPPPGDPAPDIRPPEQVVLEVRVRLDPIAQLELWDRIERRYVAYLETLDARAAAAVRRCLIFHVIEQRATMA